ncbi:MAG: phenylalanine--tRNA ligase beta subunit-related protein, partial [Candidatus Diapherotrites archaeon]|nr:phenylalanine--tRNA ligase beta subunit-related protein [Candidatus Diapherotrites archaeon]
MPSLEISKKDLESLVGKKFKSEEELEEALAFAKTELDSLEGDQIKCSPSDSNRPDLYSAEGIARELKAKLGIQKGIPHYQVVKGTQRAIVEKTVEKVRPIFLGAIVRNVQVTENLLIQMIQLQEKITQTFGRRRKEVAVGMYDYDQMKFPVYYRAVKDNEIEFVPLEYQVKMRPSEILLEHPKGKEFGHLLAGTDRYPILIDSAGVVASMPPIINSQATGKVTEKTRNLFAEV